MTHIFQRIRTAAAAIFAMLLLALVAVAPAHAATDATLSLSPASSSLTTGSTLVINVVMDSKANSIMAWNTHITYPTAYFSSASVATASGSPFTQAPYDDVAANGSISISRFSTTAHTYAGNVATITLLSNGTAGSAALTMKSACPDKTSTSNCSTVIDSSSTNVLASVSGGSYTFYTPPVSSSSTGGTVKKKTATYTPAAAPTSAAATTPAPTTPEPEVTQVTGTVTITVHDQNGKPLVGALVTVGNVSGKTDRHGKVTLRGVSASDTRGTIRYNGLVKHITLLLGSDGKPLGSTFTLTVKNASATGFVVGSIAGLLLIGGIVAVVLKRDALRAYLSRPKTVKITPPKIAPPAPEPRPAPAAVATAPSVVKEKSKPTPPPAPSAKSQPEPPRPPKPTPVPPTPAETKAAERERQESLQPGTIVHPESEDD